jgi:hypothetical protein
MGTVAQLVQLDIGMTNVGELYQASVRCAAVYSGSWPQPPGHRSLRGHAGRVRSVMVQVSQPRTGRSGRTARRRNAQAVNPTRCRRSLHSKAWLPPSTARRQGKLRTSLRGRSRLPRLRRRRPRHWPRRACRLRAAPRFPVRLHERPGRQRAIRSSLSRQRARPA